MSHLVYIVILNYNGYADTIECINSINNIDYKNYKIVVVDNCSADNSEQLIKTSCPNAAVLQSGENNGFANGTNFGINYSIKNGAEYILILNNDTLVEKHFLGSMIEVYEKSKDIGIVGAKILHYPDTNRIWYGGGKIDWFHFVGENIGKGEIDKKQYDSINEVSFITGCCMLISKNTINKIGLLPEGYFMYYEDVDYCIKAIENNLKLVYNPNAIVYHKVSMSSGGEDSPFMLEWITRNKIKFMKKNRSKVSPLIYFFSTMYFIITRIIRIIEYFFTDRKKAIAIIKGLCK